MKGELMKPKYLLNLLLMLVFLAGCGSGGGGGGGTSTASLPTAQVNVTHVPSADAALRTYLDAMSGDKRTSGQWKITPRCIP